MYAVNFIFFSSCSVVNGDECTALIPNGADPDHESYGKSAGTLYVVGALALGTSLGTTLILNEGARGKWTIMIPTIMGFTALVIVLAPPFQGDYVSASNNPLYASFIALACPCKLFPVIIISSPTKTPDSNSMLTSRLVLDTLTSISKSLYPIYDTFNI